MSRFAGHNRAFFAIIMTRGRKSSPGQRRNMTSPEALPAGSWEWNSVRLSIHLLDEHRAAWVRSTVKDHHRRRMVPTISTRAAGSHSGRPQGCICLRICCGKVQAARWLTWNRKRATGLSAWIAGGAMKLPRGYFRSFAVFPALL